jgi:DNA-binding transcriptional regulator YiaG
MIFTPKTPPCRNKVPTEHNMNKKEFIQHIHTLLREGVDEGILDMKSVKALEGKNKDYMISKIKSGEDYVAKDYISFDIGYTAYIHILENGGTAQEALEHAAEVLKESMDIINSGKNNKFFYAKDVVESADEHPTQKQMMKNNTIDKSALKKSTSANQQLRKLAQYKSVDERLTNLEDKLSVVEEDVETHEDQLEDIEARLLLKEFEIESLKKLTGLEDIPPKEAAKIMKEKGFSQKKVAELLEKDIRTIKRWWKEI